MTAFARESKLDANAGAANTAVAAKSRANMAIVEEMKKVDSTW